MSNFKYLVIGRRSRMQKKRKKKRRKDDKPLVLLFRVALSSASSEESLGKEKEVDVVLVIVGAYLVFVLFCFFGDLRLGL